MLRLLHTADVHLGARHADLGDAAAAQRERQFAAFKASVDLAISEQVDLFLVAGDLFDSNVQPKRSVERVAAELGRLAKARIRSVLVPGTHDVYDRSSVYRAYDIATLAGSRPQDELIVVLTPDHPWIHLQALDVVVHGPCFPTKRAPYSPLRDLAALEVPQATWKVGVLHAAVAIPGRTDGDEVVVTVEEIAATGLDYLALGHWHSAQVAKTKGITYAYAGAPEAIAVDQDKAGKVLLVTLDEKAGVHTVHVEERSVGRTSFARQELDASTIGSQPAFIEKLKAQANPDLVLDVRLIGVRPGRAGPRAGGGRGRAQGELPQGPHPGRQPAGPDRGRDPLRRDDHRRVHPQRRGPDRRPRGVRRHDGRARGGGAARRAPPRSPPARGPRGDAVRITSLALQNVRRYKDAAFELSPGLTVVRGPNEAGKSTLQRAIELALTRKVTSSAGDLDGLVPWDGDPDSRSAIALVFTYEDEDGGTHEGRLEKSFRGSKGQVRLELDGEVITDPARADEALAELSGLPTENFYRSTASIRHQELAEVQRDEGALRDRLQASISGADRGTSRARKKLDRALYALQTKGTKNPGRLKVADDAVTDATAKLQAGEDALGRLERDRDALAVARERRAETETALTERRAMLEKARQAERLNAEKTQAQERYERYRTAVIVRDEITELDRTHPSPTPLPVLRSTVERLRAVDRQIATLQAMLDGEVTGQLRGPARGPLAPALALGARSSSWSGS